MSISNTALAAAACCALVALYMHLRFKKRRDLLPPGPPGLPIVGNAFDIPREYEWTKFNDWSKEYKSPLIYLSVFGQHIVIANDVETATDLFEKRSSIYSDRPHSVMLNDLIGLAEYNFAFTQYGDLWRESRKIFNRHFSPEAVKTHRPKEVLKAHDLLRRLLDTPENLMKHCRHIPGSLVFSIAYGIETKPIDDPYLTRIDTSNEAIVQTTNVGAYLVNTIPILKYLPEFCAKFKREARAWRDVTDNAYNIPLRDVKESITNNTADENVLQSVAAQAFNKINDKQDIVFQERCIRSATGVMYSAGTDTVVSGMKWYFYCMLLWPEFQQAAQRQIDEVVGSDRLPDFSDEHSLPMISAIVKEVLRWSAFTPLAVPHSLTTDDVYKGYHLPKGTTVVGNAWAMLRDERAYGANTMDFNPRRFLDSTGKLNPAIKDPTHIFGWGRRMCPGRFMAFDQLWLYVACTLAVFDIRKPVDAQGNIIEPSRKHLTGQTTTPAPYQCDIKPRSSKASELIHATSVDDV